MYSHKPIKAYPLKVRRLEQLYAAGLNVADFICFAPGELKVSDLKAFCSKFRAVSCRTFAADEDKDFKTPVKYEISTFEDVLEFGHEHNRKYFLLVNEALPLKDSVMAGNIYLRSRSDFIIEYFNGPGTPRDIDSKPLKRIDSQHFGSFPHSGLDPLPEFVSRLGLHPAIFEFSLYPYPVGRLRQRLIFWEWRKG
jgi:hypothetical protein